MHIILCIVDCVLGSFSLMFSASATTLSLIRSVLSFSLSIWGFIYRCAVKYSSSLIDLSSYVRQRTRQQSCNSDRNWVPWPHSFKCTSYWPLLPSIDQFICLISDLIPKETGKRRMKLTTPIFLLAALTANTPPAAIKKTISNKREKTLNSGRVERRAVDDSEVVRGREMRDVKRYMDYDVPWISKMQIEWQTQGQKPYHQFSEEK